MGMNLSLNETRVIGCLIEKEIVTPEQYPLSLNALTNACNQKTNRNPVMQLDEVSVQQTLDDLTKKHLVSGKSGFGSRVPKYRHRFCNTEFGPLKFSAQELGVICSLLLRGPQTPGELRTHTARLCHFDDVQEVETIIRGLTERSDGPFVAQLARQPGKRESRYTHLFSGEPAPSDIEIAPESLDLSTTSEQRLTQLEHTVGELRKEIDRLKQRLDELLE